MSLERGGRVAAVNATGGEGKEAASFAPAGLSVSTRMLIYFERQS